MQAFDLLGQALASQIAAEVDQLRLVCHLADLSGVVEGGARRGVERLAAGGADGTPAVAEFLALEIGPILGISPTAAAFLIADSLNLRHRHPLLWRAVLDGRVRVWQAREITRRTASAGLDRNAAGWVDGQLANVLRSLPWRRVLTLLDGLIVHADTFAAARRAEEARARRSVWIGRDVDDGVATIVARVNASGAVFFDGMVERLSDILAEKGSNESRDVRRSQAVEIMATPARALALLQSAVQPDLAVVAPDAEPESSGRGPSGCAGHVCGRVTVPPEKLLPKATVYVHVDAESVAAGTGVARVEGLGPACLGQLNQLLAGCRVTVRPIVDLNQVPAVDCYEIPRSLREAATLRSPIEQFPFGTVGSRKLDLDHVIPFDPDGPPRQTRLDNLAPLGRRAHRAKTHGGWKADTSRPGVLAWTSPTGRSYLITASGTHPGIPAWMRHTEVYWPRVG